MQNHNPLEKNYWAKCFMIQPYTFLTNTVMTTDTFQSYFFRTNFFVLLDRKLRKICLSFISLSSNDKLEIMTLLCTAEN